MAAGMQAELADQMDEAAWVVGMATAARVAADWRARHKFAAWRGDDERTNPKSLRFRSTTIAFAASF